MNIALILAAGQGTRMDSKTPKQFLNVHGKPLLAYTIRAFETSPSIHKIVICAPKEFLEDVRRMVQRFHFEKVEKVICGGQCRRESSYLGLKEIASFAKEDDLVFIHDGARANISPDLISKNAEVARQFGVAITAIASQDTFVSKEHGYQQVYPRGILWQVQTPQTFRFSLIWKAHQEAKNRGKDDSDDAQLLLPEMIHFSEGSSLNFKVTTPADFQQLEQLKKEELWTD